MDAPTRREDLVERHQVQQRPDNPRGDPLAEGVRADTQTQDEVRPDFIDERASDTFIHGAGI
jgi:hypothetical protein